MSPRSHIQNEKIRDKSTGKILDAAFKLMAKNGYETTSISQIAKEAGVSKGLMYNYFDSKEDLLRALINNALSDSDRIMAEIASENPSEMLRNLFQWFFNELRNNSEQWKLITDLTLKIDKFDFVQDMAKNKMKEYVMFVSSLLEQIGIANPTEEAHIIAGLFDGIGFQYLVIQENYPLDKMEKYLIEKYCKQ